MSRKFSFLFYIKFGLLFVAEIKRLRACLKRSQGFTTPSRSVLRELNVEGEIPRLHRTQYTLYAPADLTVPCLFLVLSFLLLVGLSCWNLTFHFVILLVGCCDMFV